MEWSVPAAIDATSDRSSTETQPSRAVRVPVPSWPLLLLPQVQTRPPAVSTRTCLPVSGTAMRRASATAPMESNENGAEVELPSDNKDMVSPAAYAGAMEVVTRRAGIAKIVNFDFRWIKRPGSFIVSPLHVKWRTRLTTAGEVAYPKWYGGSPILNPK